MCLPFAGSSGFSALRGHVCCLKKQSDPERSDVFIVPGSHLCLSGFVYLRVQGTGS